MIKNFEDGNIGLYLSTNFQEEFIFINYLNKLQYRLS